jgi:hypothetical protein
LNLTKITPNSVSTRLVNIKQNCTTNVSNRAVSLIAVALSVRSLPISHPHSLPGCRLSEIKCGFSSTTAEREAATMELKPTCSSAQPRRSPFLARDRARTIRTCVMIRKRLLRRIRRRRALTKPSNVTDDSRDVKIDRQRQNLNTTIRPSTAHRKWDTYAPRFLPPHIRILLHKSSRLLCFASQVHYASLWSSPESVLQERMAEKGRIQGQLLKLAGQG